MSTRDDDGSTGPGPDGNAPAPSGSRREILRDFVLPVTAIVISAAAGLIGAEIGSRMAFDTAVYSSDRAAQDNLITARRLAWASYLGTLDELDRIQPDLITDPPGPRAMQRWNAAYPDTKRQAAAVIILSDDSTFALIDDLQGDELSTIDDWVQDGTWKEGGRALKPDLDTTASIKSLTKVARDSVRG